MNSSEIKINSLIENLKNLNKEKKKEDFIKNYSEYKNIIKNIDSILENKNEIDDNLTIDELFTIIEKNKNNLLNTDNLDVKTLKYLSDIISILENKLNNEKIEILELK